MIDKNLAIAVPAEIMCEQNVAVLQQQSPKNLAVADKPSFEDVAHVIKNSRPLKRPNRNKPIGV